MGLRLKLFIPTFVLLATIASMMHFYWLPNYLDSEIEQQFAHERAYIRLLGDTMIADLLSDDLDQIYETLDRVLQNREYWHSIRLYKTGFGRIYPLSDEDMSSELAFELIQSPIRFYDENLGNIIVWIDIKSSSAKKIEQVNYLEQLLLSLLLATSLAAMLFQDRWIRNPIQQLATLAKNIADGNYETVLNYQSHDEIGNLVDSFNSMREEVGTREGKLKYYSHIQNTIRHVQDKFIDDIDDKNVFPDLLKQILELTKSEHGFIGEVLYTAENKPYLKMFCASELFVNTNKPHSDQDVTGTAIECHNLNSPPGEVITSGRPVIANSPVHNECFSNAIKIKNFLGLPLSSEGKLTGVVGVANRASNYETALYDDLQILLVTLGGLIKSYRKDKTLIENEARYRAVVDNAADGIITINTKGLIVSFNGASANIFGYTKNEMINRNVSMLMPEPFQSQHDNYLNRYITTGEQHIIGAGREVKGLHKDGRTFELDLAVSEIGKGDDRLFIGIIRDISERVSAKKARLHYSKSLEQLHEITSDYALASDEKITALLKLGQEIFNLPLAIVSQVDGERYTVKYVASPDGLPAPGTEFPLGETYCCHTLSANAPTGFNNVGESDIKNHPCYKLFELESYIGAPLLVRGKRYGTLNFSGPDPIDQPFTRVDFSIIQLFAQWVSFEITRHQAETELEKAYVDVNIANSQLEKLSRTDALTGIANRRYFDETLAQELNRAMRHGAPLTLIICDIDYFKNYNDTYGHQAGDTCLQLVTKSIKASFARAGELVARYGGEEFAVILPDVTQEKAIELAESMRKNVSNSKLKHEKSDIAEWLTISAGVATLIPDHNTTMSILIEQADKALYEAKANGRDNVQVYKSTMFRAKS